MLKDKNNKIIKEGDKVKFFMGTGPADPFGYWESGIIKFIDGIFMIIDGDSEWTAHDKILEIINNSENSLQLIYDNEIKSLQTLKIISTSNIASLTDGNFHTEARLLIAKRLKNKALIKAYKAIKTLHEYPIYFDEIFDIRRKLDKELQKELFETCENAEKVWSKL